MCLPVQTKMRIVWNPPKLHSCLLFFKKMICILAACLVATEFRCTDGLVPYRMQDGTKRRIKEKRFSFHFMNFYLAQYRRRRRKIYGSAGHYFRELNTKVFYHFRDTIFLS